MITSPFGEIHPAQAVKSFSCRRIQWMVQNYFGCFSPKRRLHNQRGVGLHWCSKALLQNVAGDVYSFQ